MSTNEFHEVPHTIRCKIPIGIVCQRWLQSDGAIYNRGAINHSNYVYRQVSNIRRTLVGNKFVDHSDVVGASPVGAAPTTSSFST